jgi:CRP-like cAMP-binding protein
MAYRIDLTAEPGDSSRSRAQARTQIFTRKLAPGEELFREGDNAREIYLIKKGALAILRGKGLDQIELARVYNGSILGEMAMIDQSPRSATAKALLPTEISVIPESVFKPVLASVPGWFHGILKIIAQRIRRANTHINDSSLQNQQRGLAYILAKKFRDEQDLRAKEKTIVHADYFQIMDQFVFLNGGDRKNFNQALQALADKKLVFLHMDSSANRSIEIKDGELLELYCEYSLSCDHGEYDYAPSSLQSAQLQALDTLLQLKQKIPARNFSDEEIIQHIQAENTRFGTADLYSLKEYQILVPQEDELLAIDDVLIRRFKKGLVNLHHFQDAKAKVIGKENG